MGKGRERVLLLIILLVILILFRRLAGEGSISNGATFSLEIRRRIPKRDASGRLGWGRTRSVWHPVRKEITIRIKITIKNKIAVRVYPWEIPLAGVKALGPPTRLGYLS